MGFLNNTQIINTFDISFVDAYVSNSMYDNSHFANIAPRDNLKYFKFSGSFLSYNSYYNDINEHSAFGSSNIYLKASMRLSSTAIV